MSEFPCFVRMTVDNFCFSWFGVYPFRSIQRKSGKWEMDYPHKFPKPFFRYPFIRYRLILGGKVIAVGRKNFVIFTMTFLFLLIGGLNCYKISKILAKVP